jgi:hypothetical protein
MSVEQTRPKTRERAFGYARNVGRAVINPASLGLIGITIFAAAENNLAAAAAVSFFTTGWNARDFLLKRDILMGFLRDEEKKRGTTDLTPRAYTDYDIRPAAKSGDVYFSYNRKADKNKAFALLEDTRGRLDRYEATIQRYNDNPNDRYIFTNSDIPVGVRSIYDPHIRFSRRTEKSTEIMTLNYSDRSGYEDTIRWEVKKRRFRRKKLSVSSSMNEGGSESDIQAISIKELTDLQQNILNELPQAA